MSNGRFRMAHLGDLHAGYRLGRFERMDELKDRIDETVELSIEHEVNVYCIAGDVFHERRYATEASEIAEQLVSRLSRLAKHDIPMLWIMGNHDSSEKFREMETLLRVQAAFHRATASGERPLVVVHRPSLVHLNGGQFVCMPYPDRELMAWEAGYDPDAHAGEDPRIARNAAVQQQMVDTLHTLVGHAKFRPNLPSILAAHITTSNAATPVQEEGFLWDYEGDVVLPGSAVPRCFHYGAFGHIHMPQNLHDTKAGRFPFVARYAGSLIRLNMGEREDEKSLTIIEVDERRQTHVHLHPLTQTPMAAVRCKWEDLDRYEREKEKWVDVITRVEVEHQGEVSDNQVLYRARRIFPKYLTIDPIGPQQAFLPIEVRTNRVRKMVEGETAEDPEQWNLEDIRGTMERQVRERCADDPDLPHLLRITADFAQEVEQAYGGHAEALAEDGTEENEAAEAA